MAKVKQSEQELLSTRELRLYSEQESYLNHFAEGIYRCVWVMGRPGIGKSESIQRALRGRPHLYVKSGQVTPLALFRACHEHINEPIILDLDDMEVMLKDPNGLRLLLALGETTPTKTPYWLSTSPHMGITPRSFDTTSPLCVIANDPPRNPAICSRALQLVFNPTNLEVHKYAATWFWDQGIHNWIGQHLFRLRPLDLRWYVLAYCDLIAGRDWADHLLQACALDPAEALVQDLQHDPSCPTRKEKRQRFKARMAGRIGGSEGNYDKIWQRLNDRKQLEPEVIGSIPVRGRRPPRLNPQEEALQPPADLPQRDTFARPITGQTVQPSGRQQPNPPARRRYSWL